MLDGRQGAVGRWSQEAHAVHHVPTRRCSHTHQPTHASHTPRATSPHRLRHPYPTLAGASPRHLQKPLWGLGVPRGAPLSWAQNTGAGIGEEEAHGARGERICLPSPLVGLGLCAHACEGVNLRVSICVCECVLWLNTHPSVCTSPSVEMGWGLGPLDEVWGLYVNCGSRFPWASLFTTGVLGVCMCVCVCAQLCTAHPYMCL